MLVGDDDVAPLTPAETVEAQEEVEDAIDELEQEVEISEYEQLLARVGELNGRLEHLESGQLDGGRVGSTNQPNQSDQPDQTDTTQESQGEERAPTPTHWYFKKHHIFSRR